MRVEARGAVTEKLPATIILEKTVNPTHWWGRWASLPLKGDDYKKLGDLTAWRVTLWEGDQLLSEQKSFLW